MTFLTTLELSSDEVDPHLSKTHRIDVSVDERGLFHAVVPSELVAYVLELRTAIEVLNVQIRYTEKQTTLVTPMMASLEDALFYAIDTEARATVQPELVILYDYRIHARAWVNGDGTLAATGEVDAEAIGGGSWHPAGQRLRRSNPVSHYSIGLYAAVFEVLPMVEDDGTETSRYKLADMGQRQKDFSHWGAKLNSFPHFEVPRSFGNLKNVPYSPKAAEFFYKELLRIANIGTMIHDAYADSGRVEEAIESGVSPLAKLLGE